MRADIGETRLHLVAAMSQTLLCGEAADPLDVIIGDHYRVRAMLGVLQDFARGAMTDRTRFDLSRALATFLVIDFPRHLADEDDLLFPMLRRRLTHCDVLDPSIRSIADQHLALRRRATELVVELRAMDDRPALRPSAAFRRAASDFVATTQATIAIENAVVMPLARARLRPADSNAMTRGMSRLRCGPVAIAMRDAPHSAASPGRCFAALLGMR